MLCKDATKQKNNEVKNQLMQQDLQNMLMASLVDILDMLTSALFYLPVESWYNTT